MPAVLDAIVARALARDPARRYESAEAMADDLDRFLVEMPCADQAVPQLLQELFGGGSRPRSEEAASVTFSVTDSPIGTRHMSRARTTARRSRPRSDGQPRR